MAPILKSQAEEEKPAKKTETVNPEIVTSFLKREGVWLAIWMLVRDWMRWQRSACWIYNMVIFADLKNSVSGVVEMGTWLKSVKERNRWESRGGYYRQFFHILRCAMLYPSSSPLLHTLFLLLAISLLFTIPSSTTPFVLLNSSAYFESQLIHHFLRKGFPDYSSLSA